MPITPEQFAEIRRIVDLYHEALIAAFVGGTYLPATARRQIDALDLPPYEDPPLIEDMFGIGQVLAAVSDPGEIAPMTYAEYLHRLTRRVTPLTGIEQAAVDFASLNAAAYCRGLGNRVEEATGRILIEADQEHREWMEQEIRTATAEGIKWRKTAQEIKSDLGHATGDWARDLQRIAATESNNAFQAGVSATIAKEHGDEAHVAKIPRPDACEDCKRLYLQTDGRPRIFLLSAIKGNSNVGARRRSWKPTVGGIHPWCQCQLTVVPAGFVFDKDGSLTPGR